MSRYKHRALEQEEKGGRQRDIEGERVATRQSHKE